ncbi:HTH-type transcriptional regulator/antitoxin HipB [Leucobacter exalbidus]|uniref:HTH-type transcriptional regulator/antitoxin HipB n=2 Tax=Leucobacter exalbidus TaxID=662960 RepID=A0A940PV15_9MICO|nr:HTH-type transcriptional regulator/antitoxin HipB [Leucobacter exalbidus]
MRSARGMGAFVAERRENLGLTQQELADRAGVSRSWVARFERDGSSAVLLRVMDTLAVLGVTMEMLFSNESNESNEGGQ